MTFWRVLLGFLVSACWLLCVSVAQNQDHHDVVTAGNDTTTKHEANSTEPNNNNSTTRGFKRFGVDGSMIQRALYVLIGFTMIGLLYFLIRAVRMKKPSQKKKYGLLSNYDDSVEMGEVDSEEDDTLYEARSLRR